MAGDSLAKGARKCQFAPMGGRVTQEKWDKMFEVNDETEQRSGNADVETSRVFSPGAREDQP